MNAKSAKMFKRCHLLAVMRNFSLVFFLPPSLSLDWKFFFCFSTMKYGHCDDVWTSVRSITPFFHGRIMFYEPWKHRKCNSKFCQVLDVRGCFHFLKLWSARARVVYQNSIHHRPNPCTKTMLGGCFYSSLIHRNLSVNDLTELPVGIFDSLTSLTVLYAKQNQTKKKTPSFLSFFLAV